MSEAALAIAIVSLVLAAAATIYARSSARAAQQVARIEGERHRYEQALVNSAKLVLVEVKVGGAEFIRLQNVGLPDAQDVQISHPGLLFQTLYEDDPAGLEVKAGERLELWPEIDWDHPSNRDAPEERRGGAMGVPSWPLTLSWTDAGGRHQERRRVESHLEGAWRPQSNDE